MSVDPAAPELELGDFVEMARALSTCVLLHDAATKNILWANPAACELLGWSVEELRPLKAPDMSSSAQQYDRVIARAWLQTAVERGVNRVEWHYRTKSGRVIPTEAIATRVELTQGPAVLVQFRDIEREQSVERELRRTTSYVESLAQHTSTIAFMLDTDGTVRFATDTALAAVAAPLGGRLPLIDDLATIHLGGAPTPWAGIVAAPGSVQHVQLEVAGPGAPTWLEGTVERLADPDSGAHLMILHDVSERVRGQLRQRRESQQENYLARYTAMGDMAMAIAHELGQPLAAAYNFLTAARTHARVEQVGAADRTLYGIDSAARQIERARVIVTALRSFVGHLEHIEREEDLNEIVADCLYFVQLRASGAGIRVETHLSSSPVRVICERVLTGQVVLNLCFNAIDELSSTESSDDAPRRLVITTRDDGGSGLVAVDDSGRGLRHDPFTDSFTTKAHGSGIGLALSHRIITRQHGTIWAERSEVGGSRLAFRLPAAGSSPSARSARTAST